MTAPTATPRPQLFSEELTPLAPPTGAGALTAPLERLSAPPSMLPLYARALLGRAAGLKRGAAVPAVGLEAPITLTREWLDRYLALCGWRPGQEAPLTAGQVVAAPAQSALLMGGRCPVSALGLVHAGNEVWARAPLPVGERLWARVWFGETRWKARGFEFDMHTSISAEGSGEQGAGGEGAGALWVGRTTIFRSVPREEQLSEERAPRPQGEGLSDAAARLTLTLPPDLGRRYGAVAGDRNPIHLYPWSARLFGFKRPIMHGMWTLARAVRASGGEEPPATGELLVQFRRPVPLPSAVEIAWEPLGGEGGAGARFEARTEEGKVAVEGAWRRG